MKYTFLTRFIKKFKSHQRLEQESISGTIDAIKTYLETGRSSYGLRIKRLSSKIYEARIDIRLRIAYFKEQDEILFFCLGNHDDIARCLKHLTPISHGTILAPSGNSNFADDKVLRISTSGEIRG